MSGVVSVNWALTIENPISNLAIELAASIHHVEGENSPLPVVVVVVFVAR